MAYSTQSAVSDGTLSVLPLSIDYLSRDDITVYLGSAQAVKDVAWSWVGTIDRSIKFTPAVPKDVVVTVKRSTGVTGLYHKFSGGAQFTSKTLDESLTQTLFVAQEFSESSSVASDDLPLPVGSQASAGKSNKYARTDHVHVGMTGGAVGSVVMDTFTGDGVKLAFALQNTPTSKGSTQVFIDSVYQSKQAYTLTGPTITFDEAPVVGAVIEVVTVTIGGGKASDIQLNETPELKATDTGGNVQGALVWLAKSFQFLQDGTGAVARLVKDVLKERVSVLDFGADPTGVADSSAAAQAATATGKPVLWPAGTYKVTGVTYTGKVCWYGQGGAKIISDGTVLTVTNGTGSRVDNLELVNITAPWIITRNPSNWSAATVPAQSNGLGYQPTVNDQDVWASLTAAQQSQDIGPKLIFGGDAEGIEVRRITGRFVSIIVKDAVRSTVRDCNFRAGKNSYAGIVFDNTTGQGGKGNKALNNSIAYPSFCGVTFIRNYDGAAIGNSVDSPGESGIKTYQNVSNGVDLRCYRMQIMHNNVLFSFYDGLDISSDYPATGTVDSRHQVIGNDIFGSRQCGIWGDGQNNQVMNNTVRSCSITGIKLRYSFSQISGNKVYDCNTANTVSGEHQISVSGSSNQINGNYVRQVVANGYAIYAPDTNYVTNNHCPAGNIYVGNAGSITAYTAGNMDNTAVSNATLPQRIRQNASNQPALTLYTEDTSLITVDMLMNPRRHQLQPVAKLTAKVTYGAGGAENGTLSAYGAQGGALLPGWRIASDNAIPGKVWTEVYAPSTAPFAGWQDAGTISFALDEVANTIVFKVKYSNGTTLKSATLALV